MMATACGIRSNEGVLGPRRPTANEAVALYQEPPAAGGTGDPRRPAGFISLRGTDHHRPHFAIC